MILLSSNPDSHQSGRTKAVEISVFGGLEEWLRSGGDVEGGRGGGRGEERLVHMLVNI